MTNYNTKHKNYLHNLLLHYRHQPVSIFQIKSFALKDGVNIGITTIYRYISQLIKNNQLRKTINNKEAEYQLITQNCQNHFHVKCLGCGKLLHIDCDSAKKLSNHMIKEHNFYINLIDTTILGKCKNCTKR